MGQLAVLTALTAMTIGVAGRAVAQPGAPAPGPSPAAASPAAPSPSLGPGDPAPALRVEEFLKGEPIAALEPGKVYVIEFWATWCGPCIQAIPHLAALQAEYKDRGVTVIGVNVREMRREGGGYVDSFDAETRAGVDAFVARQEDRMAYTVAYDGAARAMDSGWLKASGSEAIPASFIVDRAGKVAWIGHPMVLRMPLHEVASGTWDAATGPGRVKRAEEAYLGAMRLFSTDLEAGLGAWDRAEKDYPVLADDLVGPKFQALLAAGACEAAYAAGRVLVEGAAARGDAAALNRVAWSIVDPNATRERRDLDLALKAAMKASELTGEKDPLILDTLARVHFSRGEVDHAIEVQARAVELADESTKPRLMPALEEYRRGRK